MFCDAAPEADALGAFVAEFLGSIEKDGRKIFEPHELAAVAAL